MVVGSRGQLFLEKEGFPGTQWSLTPVIPWNHLEIFQHV